MSSPQNRFRGEIFLLGKPGSFRALLSRGLPDQQRHNRQYQGRKNMFFVLFAHGANCTPWRQATQDVSAYRYALRRTISRFFRWISNNDTAAGVTPGNRDAWPMVPGRAASSFWQTSLDKPRIPE